MLPSSSQRYVMPTRPTRALACVLAAILMMPLGSANEPYDGPLEDAAEIVNTVLHQDIIRTDDLSGETFLGLPDGDFLATQGDALQRLGPHGEPRWAVTIPGRNAGDSATLATDGDVLSYVDAARGIAVVLSSTGHVLADRRAGLDEGVAPLAADRRAFYYVEGLEEPGLPMEVVARDREGSRLWSRQLGRAQFPMAAQPMGEGSVSLVVATGSALDLRVFDAQGEFVFSAPLTVEAVPGFMPVVWTAGKAQTAMVAWQESAKDIHVAWYNDRQFAAGHAHSTVNLNVVGVSLHPGARGSVYGFQEPEPIQPTDYPGEDVPFLQAFRCTPGEGCFGPRFTFAEPPSTDGTARAASVDDEGFHVVLARGISLPPPLEPVTEEVVVTFHERSLEDKLEDVVGLIP